MTHGTQRRADDGAAMAAALASPPGKAGREVCRQGHRATAQGEGDGCSCCGGSKSQPCHPIRPSAQVLSTGVKEHPRVLCSAPGAEAGGSEGSGGLPALWGSAAWLGTPGDAACRTSAPGLAGEPAASPAGAPLLWQGSKPTHLGLRTINFPNLHNDQLLRRTISRSQIVIVISLLILIWPNEG